MSLRISLLSAVAVAALFSHNAAQADGFQYSSCSKQLFTGQPCAVNTNDRSPTSRGIRDQDNDHGSDRNKDNGKDNGKDKEGPGGGNGGGGGGGGGGNDGGGEGGERGS